jgi:mono/diheme cytochrome c family protein
MQKIIILLAIGILLTAFIACEQKSPAVEEKQNPAERGKYLVMIGGCHDCHTPKVMDAAGMPVPDTTSLLSGHPEAVPYPTWMPTDMQQRNAIALTNPMLTAWAGPWGVSFALNLTPDTSTGLGEWTEQAFIQALRTGKHQGQPNGRDILPPMPWQSIGQMTDQDLQAVWAYLRSIPPVKNQVPLPVPPAGPPPPTP